MSYGLVSLKGQELKDLAKILYSQETEIIKSRPFESAIELNSYLDDCGIAYDYVGKILTAAGDLNAKWKHDAIKGPIADNILDYVEKALNTGLQIVRNYSVRKTYLEKLSDHTDSFIADLDQLDPRDTTKVNDLSEDVIKYRDSMANCMENYNNKFSDEFSEWIKNSGITFQDLVKRYQSELGYQGSFKDLEDGQKLQIYERIIKLSGKGNIFAENFKSVQGLGFLVILAGMMVWDVFSAKHEIGEAARKAVELATYVGTAYISDVVNVTVEALLIGVTDVAEVIVSVVAWGAGAIVGLLGTFIIGAVVGPILDFFFHSGGFHMSTDGIKCHSAPMPYGATLANQIWSQDHVNP